MPYLDGSMNLNTVPVGDVALGYEVARKYSSPDRKSQTNRQKEEEALELIMRN